MELFHHFKYLKTSILRVWLKMCTNLQLSHLREDKKKEKKERKSV